MKPEQNPKSPLNAVFLVTLHFGARISVLYCGNNENLANQAYGINRYKAVNTPLKGKPGFIKPVIKFWDHRLTVKDGVPYNPRRMDANLSSES